MSSAVTYSFIASGEKALFTPIDHLRNATTIAQSLDSTRVAAETATKIAALERRSLGASKSPKLLRFSVIVKTELNETMTTTRTAAERSLRQNGIHETHLVLLLHSDLGLFQAK